MRKSVGQAPTTGEQTQQKAVSDVFRHRSGTGKSYCRTRFDVGSERVKELSWFGHLHRTPEERMVKRVYEWKLMLRRPLGRPKNRWENDIINDMKKMKIKNWTSCIQDRNKWKLCVEKVKMFKE
jgi:hypothetical protein